MAATPKFRLVGQKLKFIGTHAFEGCENLLEIT